MFPSFKSQSRYKRSFYVSFSSSFSTWPFQSMTVWNCLQGCKQTNCQQQANKLPHIFFLSKTFLSVSQLRTDIVKCYTSYFQCQYTTRKVTPCFDLPKQNAFSLYLLCLPQPPSRSQTSFPFKDAPLLPQIKTLIVPSRLYHRLILYWLETVSKRNVTAPHAVVAYLARIA